MTLPGAPSQGAPGYSIWVSVVFRNVPKVIPGMSSCLVCREGERRLGYRPSRGVAAWARDKRSVGGVADGDGQAAIRTISLAPPGEVDVELGFGGFLEEVAEEVFAVGFPFLEKVEGEDELLPGAGAGDQGDDGVREVALALEGNARATAGHDEPVSGEVEELGGDEEQVAGGACFAFGLLEEPDQAGRVLAGEPGGVQGVVVRVRDWRRAAS